MACGQAPAQTRGMNRNQLSAQSEVFGVAFVEIINPGGAVSLPGWHTRLWPVARLGDQTLEAWPAVHQRRANLAKPGQVKVDELLTLLRAAGITPLGVRLRPGQAPSETLPESPPPPTQPTSLPVRP